MSTIEERVIKRIRERAELGKSKYGTTMDRNDLGLLEWLTHAQEEAMDLAIYLEKVKQELHYQPNIDTASYMYDKVEYDWDEQELDRRMRVIGQNGNTGEHYDDLAGTRYGESSLTVDDNL